MKDVTCILSKKSQVHRMKGRVAGIQKQMQWVVNSARLEQGWY